MGERRSRRPAASFFVAAALVQVAMFGLSPAVASTTAAPDGWPSPPPSQGGAFLVPLPIPPVLKPVRSDATTDYYRLTERAARQHILPGPATPIWGYDGITPGPTIVQRSGRRTSLTVVNHLPDGTTVHLHGAHTAPGSDGYPTDLIRPGASQVYVYPDGQSARVMWYHDHAMAQTGPHLNKGLAGFYILHDAQEDSLHLPWGANDVPIVIQDRLFAPDNTLRYPRTPATQASGVLGDTILANAAPQPYFRVANRKVRLRLLNGSDARQYRLALSNGQPLVQIGSEGGLLPAPVRQDSIDLAPAERADVVIDFSKVPVGSKVVLQNRLGSGPTSQVLRFDVVRHVTDHSTIPASLRPIHRLSADDASVTRTFTLESAADGTWTINDKPFDPRRIDADPKLGATEVWNFYNRSPQTHVMHMHDVNFQILDLNGLPPPPGTDSWTEMVTIPPFGAATVIARFEDFTGTYVFHCHVLRHEDNAMMAQFRVRAPRPRPPA